MPKYGEKVDVPIANQGYKDINPLVCGMEKCSPGHFFGPEVRMYWLLHYVEEGKGIIRAEGKEFPVEEGQIFVIRPMETTFYQADENCPWKYIWIGFSASIPLPGVLAAQRVITHRDTRRIFQQMLEAVETKQGREMKLTGCIYQLLAALFQRDEESYDYVEQAKTYIDSSYMQHVSISQLAEMLNVNRSCLSARFKEKTGKSPQQYLVSIRMEQACRLMAIYGYSVGEAAVLVGYPDVFAFSRMFRRVYGMSPTEFKNVKLSQ